MKKIATPLFGEFLPFFYANILKLCQVEWGSVAAQLF
jgi:hypothetical protein